MEKEKEFLAKSKGGEEELKKQKKKPTGFGAGKMATTGDRTTRCWTGEKAREGNLRHGGGKQRGLKQEKSGTQRKAVWGGKATTKRVLKGGGSHRRKVTGLTYQKGKWQGGKAVAFARKKKKGYRWV